MAQPHQPAPGPPRRAELLDRAYRHALDHGLAGLSLRPLAVAIASSPRVLLYPFGSKEDLVRTLLTRARAQHLDLVAASQVNPCFSAPTRSSRRHPGGAARR